MAEESQKGALIEKAAFAVLPILFTCVVYLMSSLNGLQQDVIQLQSKISLVVTNDNKQVTNTGSELAREILRQDLEEKIQVNKDMILENRQQIAVLTEMLRTVKAAGK
jgi:hypothetical protein